MSELLVGAAENALYFQRLIIDSARNILKEAGFAPAVTPPVAELTVTQDTC